MTTPEQSSDNVFGNSADLAALIGQGAFKIGSAPQNWGQDITEEFVQILTMGPGALVSEAFSSVGGFLEALETFLTQLPLEALQMFRRYIPGALQETFDTITGAVTAIMGFFTAAQGLVKFDDLQNWLGDVYNFLQTEVHQIFDIINGLIVTPISERVSGFIEWLAGLTTFRSDTTNNVTSLSDGIGDLLDALWGGLHLGIGHGKSAADVGNAAADTASKVASAASIGELNNEVLAIRNNKSLMTGIDETEESNFLLTDLFNGGSDPTDIISATASSVPVAYWRAEQAARKGFISWFGKGSTGVTGIFLDIYKANYDTSTWDLIHTSPNQIGPVDDTWRYQVYSIADELDRLDTQPSDVWAVAWRVTGTGTHSVAGKSAGSWYDSAGHTSVNPAKPASVRTGSGALSFASTTYTGDIPWFGIGIITGDIVPPILVPRKETFATAGAFTYTIPEQFRTLGCVIDVVLLGGGGGGSAIPAAPGGDCGKWTTVSLVYGVDIPLGTTSLSGTVGAAGAGGRFVGSVNGGPGGATTVVVPVHGTVTAAGGAPAAAGGFFGQGVTPITFKDVPYAGGGSATVPSQDGLAPGGGGGSWSLGGGGGDGARGQIWFVASQS